MALLTQCWDWYRARRLAQRARFLEWLLSSNVEQARARRLYRRALRLARGAAAPDDAQTRAAALAATRLFRCPPLLRLWHGARAHHKRAWQSALVLALLVLVPTLWCFRAELRLSPNLANGRAWQASSAAFGVASGTIGIPTYPLFFHSNLEQSPNIVIDLGKSRSFSRARIENRSDCCNSRALPLTLEVSSDKRNWRPLARRDVPFNVWRPTFPWVQARYVRLRTERQSYLHLAGIGVYW